MKTVLFLLVFLSGSCFASPSLMDLKQILESETKVEVRLWSTQDFGRAKYDKAVSILVPENESREILEQVRRALPDGAFAFIGTTRNLSQDKVDGVELVALVSDDKFDILIASYSDGINHGLSNKQIIEKLQEWDKAFGIDIWQAETDTIQLTMDKLPGNLAEFSKELYKFCPDIVDQGSGDVNDIIKVLKQTKSLYLWWD